MQQRNKTDNIMSPVYWTTVKTVYLFTYLCCLRKSVENVQAIIENMHILIYNVQNFCKSYMINLLTPLLIQYLVENSETLAEIMYDPDKIKDFTLNKFNENEYNLSNGNLSEGNGDDYSFDSSCFVQLKDFPDVNADDFESIEADLKKELNSNETD